MPDRSNFWKNVPAAAFKNMAEISRETGMREPAVFAVKSSDRGLSADNARKVAEMDGDKRKAGYLFLASQTAALKKKIETKKITDEGVLRSAGSIMATSTKGFRPDEVNRADPDFRKVALELKAIAETALEMVPAGGTRNPYTPQAIAWPRPSRPPPRSHTATHMAGQSPRATGSSGMLTGEPFAKLGQRKSPALIWPLGAGLIYTTGLERGVSWLNH
jgi:hypothetical protein